MNPFAEALRARTPRAGAEPNRRPPLNRIVEQVPPRSTSTTVSARGSGVPVALLIGLLGGFGGLAAGLLLAERGQRATASAPAVASAAECPTCADAAPTLSAAYPEAIQWSRTEPLTADTVSCDFRILADTDQQHEQLRINLSRQEPMLLTFTGLKTRRPRLKGNNGEGPVVVVSDDGDEIVMFDGDGGASTYTIKRKKRIAVWTKARFILASPYGLVSVGRCY